MVSQKVSDLVISRIIDAPAELVWKAWTEPKRLMRWWGPKDYTSPSCTLDLRVGGKYLFCMRGPDGKDVWGTGIFREIVPQKRLILTDSFSDPQGNVVQPTDYGMDVNFPKELLITVIFESLGEKTQLTMKHAGLPDEENKNMAGIGWNQSFDKLAASLQQKDG